MMNVVEILKPVYSGLRRVRRNPERPAIRLRRGTLIALDCSENSRCPRGRRWSGSPSETGEAEVMTLGFIGPSSSRPPLIGSGNSCCQLAPLLGDMGALRRIFEAAETIRSLRGALFVFSFGVYLKNSNHGFWEQFPSPPRNTGKKKDTGSRERDFEGLVRSVRFLSERWREGKRRSNRK